MSVFLRRNGEKYCISGEFDLRRFQKHSRNDQDKEMPILAVPVVKKLNRKQRKNVKWKEWNRRLWINYHTSSPFFCENISFHIKDALCHLFLCCCLCAAFKFNARMRSTTNNAQHKHRAYCTQNRFDGLRICSIGSSFHSFRWYFALNEIRKSKCE